MFAAVSPSPAGVRPNSPPHRTSVSSSSPRAFRSCSRAAIGWSTAAHRFGRVSRSPLWWSQALFAGASKSWTKRTPRSTSRRASRHCPGRTGRWQARRSRIAAGRGHTRGTGRTPRAYSLCMRNASSNEAMRAFIAPPSGLPRWCSSLNGKGVELVALAGQAARAGMEVGDRVLDDRLRTR